MEAVAEKRRRGRPRQTEVEKALAQAERDRELKSLDPMDPRLSTWKLTWPMIKRLIAVHRGRGMDWTTFKVAAANNEFDTYEDRTRKNKKGEPVEVFLWPQVKAYLDRNVILVKRAG